MKLAIFCVSLFVIVYSILCLMGCGQALKIGLSAEDTLPGDGKIEIDKVGLDFSIGT